MEILCWEYNEYLTKEERLEIEEWEVQMIRENDPDIKTCVCGHVF